MAGLAMKRYFHSMLETAILAAVAKYGRARRRDVQKDLAIIFDGEGPTKGSVDVTLARLRRRGLVLGELKVIQYAKGGNKLSFVNTLTPEGRRVLLQAQVQQARVWEGL